MRKRTNTKSGEEKWFLAPGTHMNAFQVRISPSELYPGHTAPFTTPLACIQDWSHAIRSSCASACSSSMRR